MTGTRFAAAQRGFLQQMVPLIRDLAQEASTSSRTSAATLAGAVTPFLPPAEVLPPVLPVDLAMGWISCKPTHAEAHPGRRCHPISVPCRGAASCAAWLYGMRGCRAGKQCRT